MNFFKPDERTINQLFLESSKVTYIIPSYQRLYSWEAKGKSDRDNQVNMMWEDLMEHFELEGDKYYFMGSMVHIAKDNHTYEVVDGQQRLTTVSLLFVAIKCFLQGLDAVLIDKEKVKDISDFIREATGELDKILFNRTIIGVITKEKKVKIERASGFDYDSVLMRAMECADKVTVETNSDEELETANRFFENRDYFLEQLKHTFTDNNGNVSEDILLRLNDFIHFLRDRVLIVRILCPTLDVAYQIFEILNNRGLPLSNKDLFRNFLIKELVRGGIEAPEKKWLKLDGNYEFSSAFLARYVESTRGRKQRKSAFNDVKSIFSEKFKQTTAKKKVELFYEDIQLNLKHYSSIEILDYELIGIKYRVAFLKNSGNTRYVNNLLLALFRNTNSEKEQIVFLKAFELFILYQLLGPNKRFQSSILFQAIKKLNSRDFDQALSKISLSDIEKADLKKLLIGSKIQDNSLAKLIVARYFWAQEIDLPKDLVQTDLFYSIATLEHIMPQKPEVNSNWVKDFSETFRNEYTYKLGNMTLLTQRSNAQAKNYDFSVKKKKVYAKSKLPMTRDLANIDKITEQDIANRHTVITNYLIDHFGL